VIGIIAAAHQTEAVEEFFELFKTPWEFYRPGQPYDIIISTQGPALSASARLMVLYGSDSPSPAGNGSHVHQTQCCGGTIRGDSGALPIYGRLCTFSDADGAAVCLRADEGVAATRTESRHTVTIRVGYDLFDELEHLLTTGQPPASAGVPSLDEHIDLLRKWIVAAGVPFVEIPPVPAGRSFIACLTHDIDFVAIRNHFFDRTMWGFVQRSTVGGVRNYLRGRHSFRRLLAGWQAVASLPLVYLGWADDFWEPFTWYLQVERGLPATYYLIPYKRRCGDALEGRPLPRSRATAYDVSDIPESIAVLMNEGCEVGVHGIDAWHSEVSGRAELERVATATGQRALGIRVHWLLQDAKTPQVLENAGYAYDSSVGYNDTIGFRAGTGQVFRPLGTRTFLELPLHIQDGALFYPRRLDLSEADAWTRCRELLGHAAHHGGVMTLLWHDRSHGPERFWGEFYVRLIHALKGMNVWFGSASQVVGWFEKRRRIRFERTDCAVGSPITLRCQGDEIAPPLTVRAYRPVSSDRSAPLVPFDTVWSGRSPLSVGLGPKSQVLAASTSIPVRLSTFVS
jgi:hypothetical protein